MIAAVQRLIDREAQLGLPASHLALRADLYALRLTCFDAVRLLLAIEREFNVEFPRVALRPETMRSIEAIVQALRAIQPVAATVEPRREAA